MPGTLSHLTVLATIAIATVPSPGIIAQAPREAIVGQWKGAIDEGGSRTEVIIEFFPNGTYARRVALTSQFGWTLSGDVLLLAPALSKSNDEISYGKASAVHMKLKDSVLVISDAQQSISLKRVTVPINEAAILGRWEGVSEQNEGITQDFLSDGRLMITVTLAREAGRYTLDESNINFEEQIPEPRRKKSRFRIADGKLVLFFNQDLPAIELARVERGDMSR